MLEIKGKYRDFRFEELCAKGKCMVCKDTLPKGTRVMRLPAPQCKRISICADCLKVLSDVANDESTYGYTDKEITQGYSIRN